MLKKQLLARSRAAGNSGKFLNAKQQKRFDAVKKALETVEEKALALAKEIDETPKDLALLVEGAVVTQGDPLGWSDQGSLSVDFSEDSYTIESMSDKSFDSTEEMLTISKQGKRTEYRLRRGSNDGHNQYKVPSNVRNVLLIKDETHPDKPQYQFIDGGWSIAKHHLGDFFGNVFEKLPKVRIQLGD